MKIRESMYWKQHCFALTEVGVVELATSLEFVGGAINDASKPAPFLCLLFKMLQINPDPAIVDELISSQDFKYLRVLGATYLRLTGRPEDIYKKLEPLLRDYRKIRHLSKNGWDMMTVDSYVETLLTETFMLNITLPRLLNRQVLVDRDLLKGPRESTLREEFNAMHAESDDSDSESSSSSDSE